MIYKQAKETSSELLRLAISSMAKHDAAYHPMNYTVWYEFLAGLNPKLQEELTHRTENGNRLNDQEIEDLYARHIRHRDEQLDQETETQLRRLLNDVCRLTSQASSDAGLFHDRLSSRTSQLHESIDQATLRGIVQALLNETLVLHQSMSQLEAELQERTRQVETLRESVHAAEGQAITDPLTGLLNRRGFARAVEGLKVGDPDRGSRELMLILLDIDHFKVINDTHGHLMGDKVIKSVARLLCANVKGRDTVARLGGEEFAILLDDTPLSGAKNVAEQTRQIIANAKFRRTDNQIDIGQVTISLGIAAYRPGETFEAFLDRADVALYESKKTGRNKISIAA